MNVDLGIWSKLTRMVIFLFALAGVLLVAVWVLPLIKQNERMRQQILRLEERKEKRISTASSRPPLKHESDPKPLSGSPADDWVMASPTKLRSLPTRHQSGGRPLFTGHRTRAAPPLTPS
jgi:hypothetical protein